MSELEQQIQNRREKRRRLAEQGIDPYPAAVDFDLEPFEVRQRYDARDADELEAAAIRLRVPGRVRALRQHGKTVFLDLHDGRAKLQLLLRPARLDEVSRQVYESLDLGDYALAAGTLIRTRSGELTLEAESLGLVAKALRPLPEKWHGLSDVESRYRQRYLDLLFNPESRRVFEIRAALIREARLFLERHGFLEVETPMMQSVAGGAAARPFVTHHNALDLQLFLRIAPELYLKRLLVGGFHRVYEINRNFRNEGISAQHNPEFTMLEFYWAYSDYRKLMDFCEKLLAHLAREVAGEGPLTWKESRLELSPPWPRYTMREAVARYVEVEESRLDHVADLAALCRHLELAWPAVVDAPGHPVLSAGSAEAYRREHPDLPVPEEWYGHFLVELFEATVEEHLVRPTFITDYPVEISPLAKQSADPRFTERFELYIGGMEIINAFSELNDPDLQAERFRQQVEARGRGDQEAHRFDHDYVLALEHGMPPAGGAGIGIDRLTMLFTGRSTIRDVILFPLLRPLEAGGEG